MNSKITFIQDEQEKWYDDNPYCGKCYRTPNYMIKNGNRYFMFNSASNNSKIKSEEQEELRKQLLSTNGKFLKFHGAFNSPIEMLQWIISKKYHFDSLTAKSVNFTNAETTFDFHGNFREVSAAFFYRVYDKELAQEIQALLKQIPLKKRGAK